MYWIALVVFVGAVLTPEIVTSQMAGFGGFREEELEVLVLAVLVGGLFLIFLWRDRTFRAQESARRGVAQDARDTTQDLQSSYKYIGNVNRKIEIVERIAQIVARGDDNNADKVANDLLAVVQTISKISSGDVNTKQKQCSLLYLDIDTCEVVRNFGRKVNLSAARKEQFAQITGAQNYSKLYRIVPSVITKDSIRAFVIAPISGESTDNDWLMRVIATHATGMKICKN